ncbi:hypothetical protein ACHAQK_012229 [Fusarium lateritium]
MSASSRHTDTNSSQASSNISSKSDVEAKFYRNERQAERRRRMGEQGSKRYSAANSETGRLDRHGARYGTASDMSRYGGTSRYGLGRRDDRREPREESLGGDEATQLPTTKAEGNTATSRYTRVPDAQAHPKTSPNLWTRQTTNQVAIEQAVSAATAKAPEIRLNFHDPTEHGGDSVRETRREWNPFNKERQAMVWHLLHSKLDMFCQGIVVALKCIWYPIDFFLPNKYVIGLFIAFFIAKIFIPSKTAIFICGCLSTGANLCPPARPIHEQFCIVPDDAVNYFQGITRADTLTELETLFKSHFGFLHRSVEDVPWIMGEDKRAVVLADTYLDTYSQAIYDAERVEDDFQRQQLSLYHKVDGYISVFPSKTAHPNFLDRVLGRANSILLSDAQRATDELLAILQKSWTVYNAAEENTPTDAEQSSLHDLFHLEIHKLCEKLQLRMTRASNDAESAVAANARVWTLNSDVIIKLIGNRLRILSRELRWLNLQTQILDGNRQTLRQGQRTLSLHDWEALLNKMIIDTLKVACEWRAKVKKVLAVE